MTQRELEEEPNETYEINLAIMGMEARIRNEMDRRARRDAERERNK